MPQYYVEKIPLPNQETDEASTTESSDMPASAEVPSASSAEPPGAVSTSSNISSHPSTSASDVASVFDDPTDMQQEPSSDFPSDVVVPKLRRTSKKSVSMKETVCTIDERGEVLEMTDLKTGDEKSSVLSKRKTDSENADPEEGAGGKRKPKGRKCHNVIYMGSEPKNECKQQ